jgi:hypothetical protein
MIMESANSVLEFPRVIYHFFSFWPHGFYCLFWWIYFFKVLFSLVFICLISGKIHWVNGLLFSIIFPLPLKWPVI